MSKGIEGMIGGGELPLSIEISLDKNVYRGYHVKR